MKNKKIIRNMVATMLLTTALGNILTANQALAASNGNVNTNTNTNLLANAIDGKLMLKADIGYIYSFAGDWSKTGGQNPGDNKSVGAGGVGYGASLGYTHKSGWGVSADYLGFNHKWTGAGTGGNAGNQYNYDASYNVVTFVPNYRVKLDSANRWGLRLGLGLGLSISDVNWAKQVTGNAQGGARVTGGAGYQLVAGVVPITVLTTNDSLGLPKESQSETVCGNNAGDTNFSDSAGADAIAVLHFPAMTGSQCSSRGRGTGAGLDDMKIAGLVDIGTLDVNIVGPSTPISYGVWRRLGKTVVDAQDQENFTSPRSKIFRTTNTSSFETRDAYITRCSAASCEGQAASADGAKAAAGIVETPPAVASSGGGSPGGSAKDDVGFVIAPQVALEYDNGMLHADINIKYLHEMLPVRYFGGEGSVTGTATSGAITYTSKSGPLALFIGAGLGLNF